MAAVKHTLYQHQSLPSTMDEARRLAAEGVEEGAIVQAEEQTAGRGRFGNKWLSPKGNLYMTVILRPQKPVREVAQLSFAVALALADAIGREEITLKWPNDLLLSGRKIAGILLETSGGKDDTPPDFLLVGTGVNVENAPEGAAQLGWEETIEKVRTRYLERLDYWYQNWHERGFGEIRSAWLSRAHGVGQPITVRMPDNVSHGLFSGIDANGSLILRDGNGIRAVTSGDIHFGPSA